jgi:hypothetical protein
VKREQGGFKRHGSFDSKTFALGPCDLLKDHSGLYAPVPLPSSPVIKKILDHMHGAELPQAPEAFPAHLGQSASHPALISPPPTAAEELLSGDRGGRWKGQFGGGQLSYVPQTSHVLDD